MCRAQIDLRPGAVLGLTSLILLSSLFSVFAAAQDPPGDAPRLSDGAPLIHLKDVSTKEVPLTTQDALTIPILCAADGTGFVQLVRVSPEAASSAMGDILSISMDGGRIVQYSTGKIYDIGQPYARNFAADDSGLYVLVRGSVPKIEVLKFKKPNGEIFEQRAADSMDYVAHFKSDGGYLGAVRLDVPFDPLQVGVFPNGDFLVAGADKHTFDPRIALVRSNGQFQRFVDLPGDVTRRGPQSKADSGESGSADSASLPRVGKAMDDSLWGAVHRSAIMADGTDLLLLRPGYKVPVFSISPGGEVKPINLEAPAGYALSDLRVAKNGWIGIYTRSREDGNGLEIETVVHDRATGKLIARYAYPRSLGLAVACANQDQIDFLTAQEPGKLILNILFIPGPSSGGEVGRSPNE